MLVQRSRLAVAGGITAVEVVLAAAAFAVLCAVVLSLAPQLDVEPDDVAYQA